MIQVHELFVNIYDDMDVTKNDADDDDTRDSNYDNITTSNKNNQKTFKAIQQVKQILGEIADTINEEEEEENNGQPLIYQCDAEDKCAQNICDCGARISLADPRSNCD